MRGIGGGRRVIAVPRLPPLQGRVRTKTVKRSARAIVERYYSKLNLDFDANKRVRSRASSAPSTRQPAAWRRSVPRCRFPLPLQVTDEVALVPSKRMRNKIAGFVTHLMRRIERGDQVRGISLKLQEEERERRMDYVPEHSAVDTTRITVDKDTKALLDKLAVDFPVETQDAKRTDRPRGERGPRGDRPPRTTA